MSISSRTKYRSIGSPRIASSTVSLQSTRCTRTISGISQIKMESSRATVSEELLACVWEAYSEMRPPIWPRWRKCTSVYTADLSSSASRLSGNMWYALHLSTAISNPLSYQVLFAWMHSIIFLCLHRPLHCPKTSPFGVKFARDHGSIIIFKPQK